MRAGRLRPGGVRASELLLVVVSVCILYALEPTLSITAGRSGRAAFRPGGGCGGPPQRADTVRAPRSEPSSRLRAIYSIRPKSTPGVHSADGRADTWPQQAPAANFQSDPC